MLLLSNKNSVLGLDIGFENIKLVQMERKGKSMQLVGFSEVKLTERILEKDRFKNKAATANLIKEACRKAKPHSISAKQIVSALPETFVFSKTIQMPKMSCDEYKKAIPTEAAQYLPMPIENVYLDFQILIVHPDEPLVDLLIVASPKQLVDDYVETSKLAGMELVALETKPIAIGRAISLRDPKEGSIIVEIGSEVTRISIWDKTIRLSTTVSAGKNQIIETLGADEHKTPISTKTGQSISATNSAVSSISDGIINAIKYHQSRDYKPKPIRKILLCGSGAKIDNIDKLLENETKIETQVIAPSINGKPILDTDFMTSFGLALRTEE